jgi:hypothetical protein
VWPTTRSLTQALAITPGWKQVYADKTATVFVRVKA